MIRLAVKARGSEVQKTMAKYTKRRDKRGYEWKSAYREKEALMLERGYLVVDAGGFDGFAGVGIGQVVWLAIGAYKGGGRCEVLWGEAGGRETNDC